MKTIRLLGAIILLGIIVVLFFIFYPGHRSTIVASSTLTPDKLIEKGEYLATVGNCASCHTKRGEAPYSGGGLLSSPIGSIAITNITPDKMNGIGNMSLKDFDNAVRYGVRGDGASMYPGMPYPAFSILNDEDIEALYTYFMHGVKASPRTNIKGDIPWYLSMRWPLNGWRMLFAPKPKPFDESRYEDKVAARGAYLIQGLGHCGTCHTPRNIFLNERAMSEWEGKAYLSGSAYPLGGWMASNLRGDDLAGLGRVEEADLALFLKSGRNKHAATFGGMSEVINGSLQYLTDDDINAMARYLKQLTPNSDEEIHYVYDNSVAIALASGDESIRGAALYLDNCAACHRTDGMGYAEVFPRLAGSQTLQESNPASTINLVLKGHGLKGTVQRPSIYSMPSLGWRLTDEEIADVVSFIRESWGNKGSAIEASDVSPYRTVVTQ